ncbi:hypothetical protein SLS62_007601 [Diatrype stigma]|uniref:Cat eye syndrome critical region protein 5 n=1 Tax=Diatrype stigma TaxID=117547 RepID=A0AAN9UYX7_9PEZI
MKVFSQTLLGRVPIHSRPCQTLRYHHVAAAASLTRTAPASVSASSATTRRPALVSGPYHVPKLHGLPLLSTRGLGTTANKPGLRGFAFAFDIDGVLLHLAEPIPGAPETLRHLQENQIPFILLTNGGGKHDADRVAELSERLGVPLSTDNFVQSHTPFRELAMTTATQPGTKPGPGPLQDKTILVTGSDPAKAREIAEAYGFRRVVIPADILAAEPAIYPFEPLLQERYAATARPLPPPLPPSGGPLKIDAIFVFNDPRDWALDLQIIADLLLSEQGRLGTYSRRNGSPGGWQADGQPALYFSNPDLFWSARYPLPRLGQGAFQAALAGMWDEITRVRGGEAAELVRTVIGKPHRHTYEYAERVLEAYHASLAAVPPPKGEEGAGAGAGARGPLHRVYMVGDNPESDIRGANDYRSRDGRTEWVSVLVRTGVWDEARDGEPRQKPKMIADDVRAAVRWALEREGALDK